MDWNNLVGYLYNEYEKQPNVGIPIESIMDFGFVQIRKNEIHTFFENKDYCLIVSYKGSFQLKNKNTNLGINGLFTNSIGFETLVSDFLIQENTK